MFRKSLIYIGGILAIIWGVAHLFPTMAVVKGFGNISADNVKIITMEWINEGLTLIFIGLTVSLVCLICPTSCSVGTVVYVLSFIMLEAMSVLSLFTGFAIDFLPFKLCPLIFTLSGLFIVQGIFVKSSK